MWPAALRPPFLACKAVCCAAKAEAAAGIQALALACELVFLLVACHSTHIVVLWLVHWRHDVSVSIVTIKPWIRTTSLTYIDWTQMNKSKMPVWPPSWLPSRNKYVRQSTARSEVVTTCQSKHGSGAEPEQDIRSKHGQVLGGEVREYGKGATDILHFINNHLSYKTHAILRRQHLHHTISDCISL